MKNSRKFVLGMAALAAVVSFTGTAARADVVATKEKVVTQSSYSVGTRRVGMVGYRPYPMVVSQTDTHTVQVSRNRGMATTSDTSSSTYVSHETPVYTYETTGGTYYTSAGDRYYTDGDLNVRIVPTGSFND